MRHHSVGCIADKLLAIDLARSGRLARYGKGCFARRRQKRQASALGSAANAPVVTHLAAE
jgi:hypothetical protein